jgi:hypothetical protein
MIRFLPLTKRTRLIFLTRCVYRTEIPRKIYDDKPLFDAYKTKQISKSSFDWLYNKQKNELNELGQTVKQTKDNFLKAVAPQVEGRRDAIGNLIDGEGGIRRAHFELVVDKMVADAVKEHKDPTQLFIPTDPKDQYSSPVGKLLKMPEFQPKLKQMMQGGANQAGQGLTKEYKTKEDIKAGAMRGEISYEEAVKRLNALGLPAATQAPIR